MSLRIAAVAACSVFLSGQSASAVFVVATDNSTPNVTDAVLAFATTGGDMAGMVVTANFADGSSNSAMWAASTATSGGAVGPGTPFLRNWSLTQSGDSFGAGNPANAWTLVTRGSNSARMTSLVIDARPGSVVFDETAGLTVTPVTELGTPATQNNAGTTFGGTTFATYSNPVGVGANAPLGDIYGVLTLAFDGGLAPGQSVSFWADTDNTNSPAVPEPGSAVLASLVAGVLAFRRRRSA